MGHIYLVRHGQASFGSADYDQLSDLGFEQARLLGEWFANSRQSFSRVVTGSLKRHRQTADTCLAMLPKAHRVDTDWYTDPGFNEYDHHEVLVRHQPEFDDPERARRFFMASPHPRRAFQEIFAAAVERWMSGEYDHDYRESWPAFQRRCTEALQRLLKDARKAESIIVFTSGGTISTICQRLLGLPDRQTAELSWTLANCGMTKLLYRSDCEQQDSVTLSYLNNYAHLEWLGQPDSVTYR